MSNTIVIVSNGYRGHRSFPELLGVDADATAMNSLFRHQLTGYDIVTVRDRSKERILETIQDAVRSVERDEQFILYFAGHALEVNGEHALVCNEASVENVIVFDGLVPVRTVSAIIKEARVRGSLVLDCCRTQVRLKGQRGGAMGLTGVAAFRDIVASFRENARHGAASPPLSLLLGCSEGEAAPEIPGARGGLFTQCLVQLIADGVKGGATIAFDDEFVGRLKASMIARAKAERIAVAEPQLILDGQPLVLARAWDCTKAASTTGEPIGGESKLRVPADENASVAAAMRQSRMPSQQRWTDASAPIASFTSKDAVGNHLDLETLSQRLLRELSGVRSPMAGHWRGVIQESLAVAASLSPVRIAVLGYAGVGKSELIRALVPEIPELGWQSHTVRLQSARFGETEVANIRRRGGEVIEPVPLELLDELLATGDGRPAAVDLRLPATLLRCGVEAREVRIEPDGHDLFYSMEGALSHCDGVICCVPPDLGLPNAHLLSATLRHAGHDGCLWAVTRLDTLRRAVDREAVIQFAEVRLAPAALCGASGVALVSALDQKCLFLSDRREEGMGSLREWLLAHVGPASETVRIVRPLRLMQNAIQDVAGAGVPTSVLGSLALEIRERLWCCGAVKVPSLT
jgi:hypothetical protein